LDIVRLGKSIDLLVKSKYIREELKKEERMDPPGFRVPEEIPYDSFSDSYKRASYETAPFKSFDYSHLLSPENQKKFALRIYHTEIPRSNGVERWISADLQNKKPVAELDESDASSDSRPVASLGGTIVHGEFIRPSFFDRDSVSGDSSYNPSVKPHPYPELVTALQHHAHAAKHKLFYEPMPEGGLYGGPDPFKQQNAAREQEKAIVGAQEKILLKADFKYEERMAQRDTMRKARQAALFHHYKKFPNEPTPEEKEHHENHKDVLTDYYLERPNDIWKLKHSILKIRLNFRRTRISSI
jgi:hypothetical protein